MLTGLLLLTNKIKRAISLILPKKVLSFYHYLFAVLALVIYGNASKKMIVIGVTGTKGKTTTSLMIHSALSGCGEKAGLLSTTEVRIGNERIKNAYHMTMPGRGFVPRTLKKMYKAGCDYVIVETPSEGILQYRNLGVKYDSLVFTNLAEEHLVTHKTYESYRAAKGTLFSDHAKAEIKYINGTPIKRFVLINADDSEAKYFSKKSKSKNTKEIFFGLGPNATFRAFLSINSHKNKFRFLNDEYTIDLPGVLSVRNALPAIFFSKTYCDGNPETINNILSNIRIPGRLEPIDEGQEFKVFCDYAHEPLSIASVYDALKNFRLKKGRVIVVAGAVGNSRWKYNAKEIGNAVTANADISIFTDVDPINDDQKEILEAVISGANKNKGKEWYAEIDRRKAIGMAVSLAKKGDVVIITGKGSEITMEVFNKSIPWDEREIIREEIRKIL